jgi:hypothetical protein
VYAVEPMPVLQTPFEERATSLSDGSSVEIAGDHCAITSRLRPQVGSAVDIVLSVTASGRGTVSLDDPASVPAELGDDPESDVQAVDHCIDVAVEGLATAFHLGRGGCIEERTDDQVTRTWHNPVSAPGWKQRAERID